MKLGLFRSSAAMLAGSILAFSALAQDSAQTGGLNIPANPQFIGKSDPTVRKATAIVNGHVITGTDVDQRMALVIASNGGQVPPEEMERLRAQVLRNLVDETLQIQEAEAKEIKVEPKDVDAYYGRYAEGFGRSLPEFEKYLKSIGSSSKSIKRQIHGELAWNRLQGALIAPFINVSEDEVEATINKRLQAKGQSEYRVSEIFIPATVENRQQMEVEVTRLAEQIRQGGSFAAYARQYSEASTAAVGGDLGWVQAEQLPEPLSDAVRQLPVGVVSNPIPVSGGFSILAVTDTRQILTADPRDAVLSLKQVSLAFAPGSSQAEAQARVDRLASAAQTIGGCGGADQVARSLGAEVVTNDQVRVRDLPGPLQDMLLALNIGQATRPFGAINERVSVLVLCGRDDPEQVNEPSREQVYAQLEEQRVNLRARRYLRDLRRDAVVDYR